MFIIEVYTLIKELHLFLFLALLPSSVSSDSTLDQQTSDDCD